MKRISWTIFLCLFCGNAYAQTVTLTATQESYNEEGVKYVAQGKLREALGKFEASLAIGEANVIYLNIGRTLFKLGECKKAKDAYAKVLTAPKVAAPTASEIANVMKKYEADLPAVCPARLEVTCKQEGVALTVNGEPTLCNGGLEDVEPGEFIVVGKLNGESYEKTVTLAEGESKRVSLVVPVPSTDKKDVITDPDPVVTEQGGDGLKWGLIIGGGIVTAGGLVVLGLAIARDAEIGQDIDCFNEKGPDCVGLTEEDIADDQDANVTLWTIGGIATGVGAAALLWGILTPSKKAKQTEIGLSIQNGMPGVRLRHSF